MKEEQNTDLQRFTTLINPQLLSNIKLISYFTNKKLYEVIDESLKLFITDFEVKSNTKLENIISFQNTLNTNSNKEKSKQIIKEQIKKRINYFILFFTKYYWVILVLNVFLGDLMNDFFEVIYFGELKILINKINYFFINWSFKF